MPNITVNDLITRLRQYPGNTRIMFNYDQEMTDVVGIQISYASGKPVELCMVLWPDDPALAVIGQLGKPLEDQSVNSYLHPMYGQLARDYLNALSQFDNYDNKASFEELKVAFDKAYNALFKALTDNGLLDDVASQPRGSGVNMYTVGATNVRSIPHADVDPTFYRTADGTLCCDQWLRVEYVSKETNQVTSFDIKVARYE